jgi:hypothetical protein
VRAALAALAHQPLRSAAAPAPVEVTLRPAAWLLLHRLVAQHQHLCASGRHRNVATLRSRSSHTAVNARCVQLRTIPRAICDRQPGVHARPACGTLHARAWRQGSRWLRRGLNLKAPPSSRGPFLAPFPRAPRSSPGWRARGRVAMPGGAAAAAAATPAGHWHRSGWPPAAHWQPELAQVMAARRPSGLPVAVIGPRPPRGEVPGPNRHGFQVSCKCPLFCERRHLQRQSANRNSEVGGRRSEAQHHSATHHSARNARYFRPALVASVLRCAC